MTTEEIKALQEENYNLKKDISRLGDESAKRIAAVHKEYQTGKKPLHKTTGEVTVTIIPIKGGKAIKKSLKVKDGHPFIRLDNGDIVESSALLSLASKGKLSEEEAENNSILEDWDKKKAVAFLSACAAKNVGWLVPVGAD